MTQRQKQLHNECIRISDIFQLGLDEGEKDWLYKFIKRMDDNKVWDKRLFLTLDFLSKDFIEEFPKLYELVLINNPTKILSIVGFNESLKHIPARYSENIFVEFIRGIRNELKDEFVEDNIELFDNSCFVASRFSYSNRVKESAWYWVFESTSISDKLKEKYKRKSRYTDIYDANGMPNNKTGNAYYDAKYSKIEEGVRV